MVRSAPAATPAAATAAAALAGGGLTGISPAGCEHGEFLGKLRRAATRTFRPPPIAGTDQDLAVLPALFAMKLINRHGLRIACAAQSSSPVRRVLFDFVRHLAAEPGMFAAGARPDDRADQRN